MSSVLSVPSDVAYGDESFLEAVTGGYYILATAVFDPHTVEEARTLMRSLWWGRPGSKLHWKDLVARQRHEVAKQLADLEGLHMVAVGSPVPPKCQERACAMCLTQLFRELYSCEVRTLYLEAREQELNNRDIQTVVGARFDLPKGAQFRVEHRKGGDAPLLWAADAIAGAIRARYLGDATYSEILAQRIYDFEVDTGC